MLARPKTFITSLRTQLILLAIRNRIILFDLVFNLIKYLLWIISSLQETILGTAGIPLDKVNNPGEQYGRSLVDLQ